MRDRGPRPVVKIRHVKSSRVDPRIIRVTEELACMVTSRMHHNTSCGVMYCVEALTLIRLGGGGGGPSFGISRDNSATRKARPANLWESKTVFCDPKNCIFPKKLYFIIKTIFWGEKKYFCARSAHHEREVLSAGVQGPKGPGSTRVLGALWCNLSLIFEHYSKTLTKFS